MTLGDRDVALSDVAAATRRLIADARTLDDDGARAASTLPGWSRGHVLTHIARNGEGMARALRGVATGTGETAYRSLESRDADITAGAGRSIADLTADLERCGQLFADAVSEVPADRWDTPVRMAPGRPEMPAHDLLGGRLREITLHHIDLDTGYTAHDWPPDFARRVLATLLQVMANRGMDAVTLQACDPGLDDELLTISAGTDGRIASGPAHALVTWVAGRDDGKTLEVVGGTLPTPPPFG